MKLKKCFTRFLIVLVVTSFLASFSFFVVPVHAQGITFAKISGRGVATGTATAITVTLNATPVRGDVDIAVIGVLEEQTTMETVKNITQTGVTWTQEANATADGVYYSVFIWYGVVGSGIDGTSVNATVNLSVEAQYGGVADIYEYSGLATSNFLDLAAFSDNGYGATTSTGQTTTTTSANELWIGGIISQAVAQKSPTNGFTMYDGTLYEYNQATAFLAKIVSAKGIAYTNTTITSHCWCGCIATFFAASSAVTNPTYSLPSPSYNNTVANKPTLFSCKWTNGTNPISMVLYSTNATGTWSWNNTATLTLIDTSDFWANFTATLTSTIGAVVDYFWIANDTSGNWNTTMTNQTLTTTYIYTTPPTYSGVASNATIRNTAVNCSVLWNDDTNVSGVIFGCNFTGSWVNQTWTSSWTIWINSTAARYDYITTLSSNVGDADQWEQWCNDTSNNWNNTGIQTITTTLYAWTACATFIITVSGSNYQAWYGANSTLAFQSTNASQVGNFAFGNLTSGIQQTVVFIGNFTLTSSWLIPSYCTADFTQANITASASITSPFLLQSAAVQNGGSNTNINITGGQFYTHPATSTTYAEAIEFYETFNFSITKTWISCAGEASGYGQGIDVSDSQFGTIAQNTVFYSGDDEIDITNCAGINISGNSLGYGLNAAIDVEGGSSNIIISENQIYNMSPTSTQGGIEVHWHTGQTPNTGITIDSNSIFNCCYGVGVDYTSGNAGSNTNIIISNNIINDSARNGIFVAYANSVNIVSNNIYDSGYAGIRLGAGGGAGPVSGFTISNDIVNVTNLAGVGDRGEGISLDQVSSGNVTGNVIQYGYRGIIFFDTNTNVQVTSNVIEYNTRCGIKVDGTINYGNFSWNTIANNGWYAIRFGTNSYLTVSCNTFYSNSYGTFAEQITSTGKIIGNTGYNPVGYITNPLYVASGNANNTIVDSLWGNSATWISATTYTNVGSPKVLYITGGTVTAIAVDGQTLFTTATTVSIPLQPGDTFSVTFSIAPTITVFGQ